MVVAVEVAHTFGSRCGAGLRDGVLFVDAAGEYVAYPVGRHMCFRHVATGDSVHHVESPQVLEIVACAVSPSRTVLAVCERCVGIASVQITMHNVKVAGGHLACEPVKTLQGLEKVGRINCMALSADAEAKYLVVSSLEPELLLAVMDWQENEVVGRFFLSAQMDRLALSPWEDGLVSGSGDGTLSFWAFPGKQALGNTVDLRRSRRSSFRGLGELQRPPDWGSASAGEGGSSVADDDGVSGETPVAEPSETEEAAPYGSPARSPTGSGGEGPLADDFSNVVRMSGFSGPRGSEDSRSDELQLMSDPSGLGDLPPIVSDHAWAVDPGDGTLVACTLEGQILIILARLSQEMRLLRKVDAGLERGSIPRCVRCFSSGFAVGGDAAAVAVWARGPAVDEVTMTPESAAGAAQLRGALCTVPSSSSMTAAAATGGSAGGGGGGGAPESSAPAVLCLDATSESSDILDGKIVLGFEDNNIGLLPVAGVRGSSSAFGAAPSVASGASGAEACELLGGGGAHRGPVVCLDMALHRPVVVTASRQECAVRVWNYSSKRCELAWTFAGEEPLSVAIHPLGYLLAVAFSDRIRLMQVLVSELKTHRDIAARAVRLMRFSCGGHLLAAAQGKVVLVFSARTLASVAVLRGHSQQVVSLSFNPDDRTLVTCGADGSLVAWNTQTWNKVREHIADRSLGGEAQAVTASGDAYACVALEEGGKHFVRLFQHCAPLSKPNVQVNSQLLALHRHDCDIAATVFAATAEGKLWWYTPGALPPTEEMALHIGPCLDMRFSADGRTAVTCGEDGMIFVLRLHGVESDLGSGGRGRGAEGEDGDVVMVNKGELQAQEDEIRQLLSEGASLKVHLVEETARIQGDCGRRVAEARQEDRARIEVIRAECEALQQSSTAQEREALRQMRAMEAKHLEAADGLESSYDKTIAVEEERFQGIEDDLRALAERLVATREETQRQLSASRAHREQELQRRVGEKDAEVQKLKDLINFTRLRFDTMLDQEEAEHDLEKSEVQRRTEKSLEEQQMVEYRLKKEQDTILRGLDMMERDRERSSQEQYEQGLIVRDLAREVEELQRTVAGLKADRRDREATLRDKELEIGAYKTKVNTLKKFKNVLDFRLNEVSLSMQPKDENIAKLSGQLRDLEQEFESQLEEHKQMQNSLTEFDAKIKQEVVDNGKLKQVIQQRDKMIREFTEDLRALATTEQDIRRWPDGIRKIYKKHARLERMAKDLEMEPAMKELARQIKATQKRATTLTSTGRAAEEECQADIRHKVDENFELIQELGKLRKEKKEFTSKMKNLELRVQQAEKSFQFGNSPAKTRGSSGSRKSPLGLTDGAEDGSPRGSSKAMSATVPDSLFGSQALAQVSRASEAGGGSGKLRKAGSQHRLPEERRQMQKLLAAADIRTQQAQMQRLENKLLQDQLESLQRARAARGAPGEAGGAPPEVAAGGGLAAARRVAAASR